MLSTTERPARDLSRDDAAAVLSRLREDNRPVAPELIGMIGPDAFAFSYAAKTGTASSHGAEIPYAVEAWASAQRAEKRGSHVATLSLLLNRTPAVAVIQAGLYSNTLLVDGCGMRRVVAVRPANYAIIVGIIAPYIELATDGKEPALSPFGEAIADVIRKACAAAWRALARPAGTMSIKDAAWQVMARAYAEAAGREGIAHARQVMYAARPQILELTGKDRLDDRYFTQTLLPDYIAEHFERTGDWNVVFDARGTFIEPHTDRAVALGTVEVRQYLGGRPRPEAPAALNSGAMSPTTGPEHRYSAILFIEKEGFGPLLERARIAERFDVAIMSTKGMSTTAARLLLDHLAPRVERVLVLHDFDVAGFSIFGTLGTDGRRYRFRNDVPVVDLGLRLADVTALGLQSEPVETSGDWDKRSATLSEHGADEEEIEFLRHRRVELNAMNSDVLVAFLERKFAEQRIRKVVPTGEKIEQHARRVITREITNRALETIREQADAEAAAIPLPDDLRDQVVLALQTQPDIPWDLAVADIARRLCSPCDAA